ncbi:MAG: DUF6516 family protein [Chloroflexota bacterium]
MNYDYSPLVQIALAEFSDIVTHAHNLNENVRFHLNDGTYIDVWYSIRRPEQRFAFHWERRAKDGTVWRYDNIPDAKWSSIATFPKHFHAGKEENVVERNLSDDPPVTLREFLSFARKHLQGKEE